MAALSHLTYHVPGLMLAIANGADPVIPYSSGTADITLDIPWSLGLKMHVGQITESFAVSLVLNCVKTHGLNLDDPLQCIAKKHKKDNGRLRLLVEEYNQLKPVTTRDLLQHTSGLPSYSQTSAYIYRMSKNPNKVWQIENYLDLITGIDIEYSCGYWKEKRGYHSNSSTNYILIGMVLEAVTGSLVSELMSKLFISHDLNSTSYCRNGVLDKGLSRQLVHGYLPTSYPYANIFERLPVVTYNGTKELKAYDVTSAYNLNGLSGMAGLSSASDLIEWMRILWREQVFGDPWEVFFEKPASVNWDGRFNKARLGMCFRHATIRPYGEMVWCKGRVYGYESLLMYSLDHDKTFLLAVNSNRSPIRVLTGSDIVGDALSQVFA